MFDSPRQAFDKAYTRNPSDRELAAIHRKLDAVRRYQQQSDERGQRADANAMHVEILSQTAVEAQKEADALLLEWYANRKSRDRGRQERRSLAGRAGLSIGWGTIASPHLQDATPLTDTHYDAIIIGAGHNGLVCACYLAKAGHKVLVLERRPVVGGAVCTEEIWPGYKIDIGSSVHLMIHRTPIVADLRTGKVRAGIHRDGPVGRAAAARRARALLLPGSGPDLREHRPGLAARRRAPTKTSSRAGRPSRAASSRRSRSRRRWRTSGGTSSSPSRRGATRPTPCA